VHLFLAEASVSSYRSTDLSVRPAWNHDLPELRRLIEMSSRAHLNLDWWTLDDWVGNPAFLVAQGDGRIVSLGWASGMPRRWRGCARWS
jgi:hypothetical protein